LKSTYGIGLNKNNKQAVTIFLRILEEMEESSKEMILLQIKLDIEAGLF
jgi:hypothetical protein